MSVDFNVSRRPDQDAIAFEMAENGTSLAKAILDASDIDNIISILSKARMSLKDEVPRALEPQARLEAVLDPVWKCPAKHSGEGKVLAVRHPGLGWLAFDFPEDQATEVGQWLSGARP
jgi:hypothetical protein